MSEQIKDGTGTGYLAKVDNTNRLRGRNVSENFLTEAVRDAEGFAITPGLLTLTSANQSAILYFKNNEQNDFVLTRAICTPFRTTGGTEDFVTFQCRYGATGMSSGSGTDASFINLKFGDSNTVTFDSEVGQEGASLSGSTSVGFTFAVPFGQTFFADVFIRIPPGQSFAILITPPPSNTSCVVVGAVNGYLDTRGGN